MDGASQCGVLSSQEYPFSFHYIEESRGLTAHLESCANAFFLPVLAGETPLPGAKAVAAVEDESKARPIVRRAALSQGFSYQHAHNDVSETHWRLTFCAQWMMFHVPAVTRCSQAFTYVSQTVQDVPNNQTVSQRFRPLLLALTLAWHALRFCHHS